MAFFHNEPLRHPLRVDRDLQHQVNGQLMNADAFKPLIVAYRHGAPVRLSRIATVRDDVENNMNASWLYNKGVGRTRCRRRRRDARDAPQH
jgi:hypothetical protein